MYKDKTFLAIIPARGGSKRLPRKNILDLNGKPLIAWSIESAMKSRYILDVVVTSDDEEILTIAKEFKSHTIKRPSNLANDNTSTFEAIKHTIEQINQKYDYVVLLQPTSPLRNSNHIDEAIELLKEKEASAVVSVCKMEHSPLWTNTIPKNLSMSNFLQEEIANKRSQDLEEYYRLNGAIYICNTKKLLENKNFFLKDNIYAYIMDKKYSVDIDDIFDFEFVEFLMSKKIKLV